MHIMALDKLIFAPMVTLLVSLGLLQTPPAADKPDQGPEPPPNDPAVVWLDKLERRGDQIKSFQAAVVYIREQQLLGDKQTRYGSVTFHQHEGKARFSIDFATLVVDDRVIEQQRRFIFDGQWLAEAQHDRKLFIRRQVVAEGQSFNPLKIGEGPFPLPIGQKRKDVLAMFSVQVIDDQADQKEGDVDDDKPAAPSGDQKPAAKPDVHLRLTPRPDAPKDSNAARFKQVDMWFNPDTLLPTRMVTDDGNNVTTVRLNKPKLDGVSDEQASTMFNTAPPAAGEGWKVEVKPFEDP